MRDKERTLGSPPLPTPPLGSLSLPRRRASTAGFTSSPLLEAAIINVLEKLRIVENIKTRAKKKKKKGPSKMYNVLKYIYIYILEKIWGKKKP